MSEKRKVSLSSHLNNFAGATSVQSVDSLCSAGPRGAGRPSRAGNGQSEGLLQPLDQSETIISQLQVIGVRGIVDNMVRVHTDNNENESAAGLDDHLGRCQQGLC